MFGVEAEQIRVLHFEKGFILPGFGAIDDPAQRYLTLGAALYIDIEQAMPVVAGKIMNQPVPRKGSSRV